MKLSKGFTLVEILVAVGVFILASVAFIPSFKNAFNDKAIKESASAVKDALATVRTRATTETGNPGVSEVSKYKYAGIKFTQSSGTYQTFRVTEASVNSCSNPAGYGVMDASKTLSSNVIVKMASGETPTCVFFAYKTGVSYITKGANVYTCAD